MAVPTSENEDNLKYTSSIHTRGNFCSRAYLTRVTRTPRSAPHVLGILIALNFYFFQAPAGPAGDCGRPRGGAGRRRRTCVRSSRLLLSALWYRRSVWCSSFSISRTCRLQLRSSRSNFSTFRLNWASSGSGDAGGDGDNGDGASAAMGSGARQPVRAKGLRSG